MRTMSADEPEAQRRPKGRSPSYPGINLEAAIERARQIWEKENKHPVAVPVLLKHWGYESPTGPGSIFAAALRKYGLLEYEGSGPNRRAHLTDLAIRILRSPHEHERQSAIKDAALNPAIIRELWEKYKDTALPTDATLAWDLEQEKHFTTSGAAEFIPVLRDTIAFAQLTPGDTVQTQTEQRPTEEGEDDDDLPARQLVPRRRRRVSEDAVNVLTIPLPGRSPILVEGATELSERDWEQFLAVLTAMKPGLIRDDDREPTDDEEKDW